MAAPYSPGGGFSAELRARRAGQVGLVGLSQGLRGLRGLRGGGRAEGLTVRLRPTETEGLRAGGLRLCGLWGLGARR